MSELPHETGDELNAEDIDPTLYPQPEDQVPFPPEISGGVSYAAELLNQSARRAIALGAVVFGALGVSTGIEDKHNTVPPPEPQRYEHSSPEAKVYWEKQEVMEAARRLRDALPLLESYARVRDIKDWNEDPNMGSIRETSRIDDAHMRKLSYEDLARVSESVRTLHRHLLAYPKPLRSEVLDDPDLITTFQLLNRIGAVTVEDRSANETGPSARVSEVVARARDASSGGVLKHGDAMIDALKMKMRDGHMAQLVVVGEILRDHVRNVARGIELDQINDSQPDAVSVLRLADRVFREIDLSKDAGAVGRGALLSFLAKAGHTKAIDRIAHELAERTLTLDELPGLFTDDVRSADALQGVGVGANFVERGAEMTSATLLAKLGIPSGEFVPYWSELATLQGKPNEVRHQRQMRLYNRRLEHNIRAVLHIEHVERGGTLRLQQEYGIRFPGRYPKELLAEQLKVGIPQSGSYSLSVAPLTDHNGAFDATPFWRSLYGETRANGSALRVFEGGTKEEIARHLMRAFEIAKGRPAELLAVAGHGSSHSIEMGKGLSGRGGNSKLDWAFFGSADDRTSIVVNGPILLNSCSTGTQVGVAQAWSSRIPNLVSGPDKDAWFKSMNIARSNTGQLRVRMEFGSRSDVRTRTYKEGYEAGKPRPTDDGPGGIGRSELAERN